MSTPSGSKAFALKFISGKYQGGEFPLKTEKQIVIGRSSELDMVLVEDMVSRKHAKITVDGGGRSPSRTWARTNGTFVNGEKVKQAQLKEGDRILIGTSILKLVQQGADAERAWTSRMAKQQAGGGRRGAGGAHLHQDLVHDGEDRGDPAAGPAAALPHLEEERRAGGERATSEGTHLPAPGPRLLRGHRRATTTSGRRRASTASSPGSRATSSCAPPDTQEFMVELDSSTEALLMDALRQLDEFKRIQKDLPAGWARASRSRSR